ncbi:MAG: tachylectin-related carbohydrate-binding protein [Thermoanaerobaculia bacterium]
MATDAIITLSRLHCFRENDGTGHSEPYIWPVLLRIDDTTLETDEDVGVSPPRTGNARIVIKNDMRAGESADIPFSVGELRVRLEDGLMIRRLILAVALWEEDETPGDAVRAGFKAFHSELRAAVADELPGLASVNQADRDESVRIIKERVAAKVESAIRGALTWWQKARVAAGTLNLDDIVDSDFVAFPEQLVSMPFQLTFGIVPSGRLLRYVDASQTGGGDVSSPSVIGQGGWLQFKFLFSGGNNIIYAVDQAGRLLFYRDASQTGGGDVSNPSVIGLGGWQQVRHLFSGGNGVIYAVDQAGRLLRYLDANQDGTGDVANPAVIGQGGWQQFKFLFPGSNNVIYAVDQAGRLLRYVDASQTGGGDVSSPSVIGQGGWQVFKFLFSGANNVIYAVDQDGRLLRYVDASQTGGGDVSSPSVVGQGGWQVFRFLFSGDNNVIYAVDQAERKSDEFAIDGELRMIPVVADPCQAQVDQLKAAQATVDDIDRQIRDLTNKFASATAAEREILRSEIKRLREEDLPAALAALEQARQALQACRASVG